MQRAGYMFAVSLIYAFVVGDVFPACVVLFDLDSHRTFDQKLYAHSQRRASSVSEKELIRSTVWHIVHIE